MRISWQYESGGKGISLNFCNEIDESTRLIGDPTKLHQSLINLVPNAIKFTQADNSTTRKYGGSGLGLTITKNMIELMGGSLDVDSTEGAGGIFSLTPAFDIAMETGGDYAPFGRSGGKIVALTANGLRNCWND